MRTWNNNLVHHHEGLPHNVDIVALMPTSLNEIARLSQDGNCYMNGLPSEILGKVFIHVRTICLSDEAERGVPAWVVSLTHTCSRWRAIALDSQLLWSRLPGHVSFEWQQAFIDRSGNASLELTLHLNPSDTHPRARMPRLTTACDILRVHLRRTTLLWLTADISTLDSYPLQFAHLLDEPLTQPAPELRSFRMHVVASPLAIDLPSDLFRHEAVNLTSIDLCNVLFKWSSLAFPGLVCLKIKRRGFSYSLDPDDSGTFPEVLSLLSALPVLEQFELDDAICPAMEHDAPRPEVVVLSKLKVLRLYARTELVMDLVTQLGLPETTMIHLTLPTLAHSVQTSMFSLLAYLNDNFHSPMAMEIELSRASLCFDLSMHPEDSLQGYGTLRAAPLTVDYRRPHNIPLHFFVMMQIIIVQAFDFENLTALHIESEAIGAMTAHCDKPASLWLAMLRSARAVEELSVKGSALPELCLALALPVEEEPVNVDREPEPFMPSLKRLILWNHSFASLVAAAKGDLKTIFWDDDGRPVAQDPSDFVRGDDGDMSASSEVHVQKDILAWIWEDERFEWVQSLRKRAQRWRPIEHIAFKDCTGLPEHWYNYIFGPAGSVC